MILFSIYNYAFNVSGYTPVSFEEDNKREISSVNQSKSSGLETGAGLETGDNQSGGELLRSPPNSSANKAFSKNDQIIVKSLKNNDLTTEKMQLVTPINPQVANNELPSKVTVEFNSIRINNEHEGYFSGNGEYNLILYVQGYMIDLTKAFPSGRNELWDVGDGEQLYFKPDTRLEVDASRGFLNTMPVYIFTLGDEVDQCQNPALPTDIYRNELINKGIIEYPLDSDAKWLNSITKLRSWFNSQTDCPTLSDRNEHLGTITESYGPPGYMAGRHEVSSSNGDFTLRFTIYAGDDTDKDGISDYGDNCRTLSNPDQKDSDRDGKGDKCDSDSDNDGIANSADNCRSIYNPNQSDFDDDGRGDKCDPDADGDGVIDRRQSEEPLVPREPIP